MKNGIVYAAIVCGILSTGTAVQAADMTPMVTEQKPVETKSGWEFTVTPYFWMAGLSGDSGLFGLPTVHMDQSFSDILPNLDFAFMATAEARNGRYSFFGDIIYTKLSADATARGIFTNNVEVTSKTFAGLLGAGYAIIDEPNGHLDVVAGARLWSANTRISFSGGVLDGVSRDDGATWVDGLVGTTGWGLIGAGGADLDWDVGAGLGYKFNETFSAIAGYRALGVDYSNDGFLMDIVQQGPILGLAIHF
jgi:hypothetical protein